MELLLRLEGEVLTLLADLGAPALPGIEPRQFLGLELNPRAAVIAELVLWIGWLRWRIANDPTAVPEPVLQRTDAINFGRHGGYDAVLARTDTGEVDYDNPRQALWPEADFIVGNPPFIGGKDLREKLGGDYAEALWKANPDVPPSADFVMQWWNGAAWRLTRPGARLQRFGFVTTNSITQTFSRRVIEARLSPPLPLAGEGRDGAAGPGEGVAAPRNPDTPSPAALARVSPLPQAGEGGLSLVMAIPDHPWTKATRDSAAVRIAMTVAEAGIGDGRLIEVVREAGLDSDAPEIVTTAATGRINADLTLGADVTSARPLLANAELASPGVKLHGAGFIVSPADAVVLGLGTRPGLENHIRPYRNGRDLMGNGRGVMVIDLDGLSEKEVRVRYPEVYQHVLMTVRPERETNREDYRRINWWLFGRRNTLMRGFTSGLSRYIVTVETAKHRVFQFLDASILPDNKLIVIGSEDAFDIGVLSSRIHYQWWLANAGMMGVYDQPAVYVKTLCFDPFPFPDPTLAQRAIIAELGEEIDATRKTVQAEYPDITLTGLYNLVEKLRAGAALLAAEADTARRARAAIILELHRRLDAAVAAAYGWPADLAPAEIVARLVALNAERAAEEAAGKIRWLRPDYQARA
ncbi:MAG: DNA methyltransferase [Polymorphobacter sp.]